MKAIIPLFVILLATVAPAQTSGESAGSRASAGTWTLASSLVSQYMFRGVRADGASFQPSLEYVHDRVVAGIWSSMPLDAGAFDPEVDFYGFYTVELTKDLSVEWGASLYTYPTLKPADGYYRLTFEPSFALNYAVGAVVFTPKLYYDVVLQGLTAELSAAFAVPLPTLGTELDFLASAGTYKWADTAAHATPAVRNRGDYYLLGFSIPYQFGAKDAVRAGWAYTAGSQNYYQQGTGARAKNPDAVGRGFFSVSYSRTF